MVSTARNSKLRFRAVSHPASPISHDTYSTAQVLGRRGEMNDDFEANVTDDKPRSVARPRFMNGLLMRAKAIHWIVAGFVLGLTLGLWLISVRDNSSNAAINQSPVTVAAAERIVPADIANNLIARRRGRASANDRRKFGDGRDRRTNRCRVPRSRHVRFAEPSAHG